MTVPMSMRGIYSFLHVFHHSYTNSVSEHFLKIYYILGDAVIWIEIGFLHLRNIKPSLRDKLMNK